MRLLLGALLSLLLIGNSPAQVNPFSATGGRVVLMGIAQSQQEASLAVAKIRGIKGVKSLNSHLRMVPAKR